MKKLVPIFVLFILALSLVSAIDIDLEKDSYYPSQTLQVEITGSFPDGLNKNNIRIYEQGKVHSAPTISGLHKTGVKYLYYASLPSNPGNYSISIEDTRYYSQSKVIEEPFSKNFTIDSTNKTYLTFNPGIISTTQDFEVTLKSINGPLEVTGNFNEDGSKDTTLIEGISKKLKFSIASIKSYTESTLELSADSSYKIPVFVSPKLEPKDDYTIERWLWYSPEEARAVVKADQTYSFPIFLKNVGNETFRNIEVLTEIDSEYITITPELIEDLDPKKNQTINVTINVPADLEGAIDIRHNNQTISLEVGIRITEDDLEVTITPPNEIPPNTCDQINGKICSITQTCSASTVETDEGLCCTGTCQARKKSTSRFWGLIIIIVILAGAWWVFKKMRKPTKKKSSDEAIKKSTKRYEQRFKPVEVRKSLGKN